MGLLLVDAWICCCIRLQSPFKELEAWGRQLPHLDSVSAHAELTLGECNHVKNPHTLF